MSREIKFRIWNPSGNNILYDIDNVFKCLEQQLSFDKTMPNRGFTVPYNHKGEGMVWMEFTGVKDEVGEDIFEGDILQFPFEMGIAYVINDGFRFAVKSPGSEAIDYEGESVLKLTRRIGNIYENPELIKL